MKPRSDGSLEFTQPLSALPDKTMTPAPVEITNTMLRTHQGDVSEAVNKCKFCGKLTTEAVYCSEVCYHKQYRKDNREELNRKNRDRLNGQKLEARGGVERIKCSNPDCNNLARSNRRNATCSAKCDMVIYWRKHPVVNKCALVTCDKPARTNKPGSVCCTAHRSAVVRRQAAEAEGKEYSTKIGRTAKPPVVLKVVCACGCGETFETPKRSNSRHQRRYVDNTHIGRHQSAMASERKAAGLFQGKTRECFCGCGKKFFVSEYPSRKYAPGCTNKPEGIFKKPAEKKQTPPPAILKPGTHAPYANTYVQLKNMPETSRREQARIEKIIRASRLPGYNKHTPERFIRMLKNDKTSRGANISNCTVIRGGIRVDLLRSRRWVNPLRRLHANSSRDNHSRIISGGRHRYALRRLQRSS